MAVQVNVRLWGELKRYAPGGEVALEVADGSDVRSVAREIGIPEGELGAATVNGRASFLTVPISDGSVIEIFPPIAGGSHTWCAIQ